MARRLVPMCAALLLCIAVAHGSADQLPGGVARPVRTQQPATFFEETFEAHPSSGVWQTELLSSGQRWCADNPGCFCGPGQWVDPALANCHGLMQQPPYGSAVVTSGVLQLSSVNMPTFPYLASRYPGDHDLFPATGDFRATIRMKYDHRTGWGSGVVLVARNNTVPIADQYPVGFPEQVLAIWCDPDVRLLSAVSGRFEQIASVADPDSYHEYMLEYVDGTYLVSIDGTVIYGPAKSTLRPTAILIGNPVFSYWGTTTWSAFSLDYIRVLADTPVPANTTTLGQLKARFQERPSARVQ